MVRNHPSEPGGIDQDVGAAEFLSDRCGDLADLRAVLQRQMHRLMEAGLAAADQSADHRIGAVEALVVADHDPRAGLGEQPRAGGADAAAGAGNDRDLAAEILADPRRHPVLRSRWSSHRCYALARGIVTAFGRPPTEIELKEALGFLEEQGKDYGTAEDLLPLTAGLHQVGIILIKATMANDAQLAGSVCDQIYRGADGHVDRLQTAARSALTGAGPGGILRPPMSGSP